MSSSRPVGFWYRLGWWTRYALLTAIGPAQLEGEKDPRQRMRTERAARERRALPGGKG